MSNRILSISWERSMSLSFLWRMDLMHGGLRAQALAGERDEIVGPCDDFAAGRGGIAEEVVGEEGTPGLPVLGVQIPAVPGLQLFDRFDLTQGCDVVHP